MGKISSAAKNKYNAKAYDRITITVPKGQKATLLEYALKKDGSLAAFIKRAMRETMQRDNEEE